MAVDHRRRLTPCIGICSTTYGDLVCRGCKRFAHEIVGWNGYSPAQKDLIWSRLHSMQDAALATRITLLDETRLLACSAAERLPVGAGAPWQRHAWEVLQRLASRLDDLGVAGLAPVTADVSPVAVRDAVDAEFHLRSRAAYEYSFKVLAT